MGEDEEDADDEGDATAPPATTLDEIDEEGPVEVIPEQEALVPHEVLLADVEPEMPQLCL
jgi:hypothetical protein